jgi:hypothetical protein
MTLKKPTPQAVMGMMLEKFERFEQQNKQFAEALEDSFSKLEISAVSNQEVKDTINEHFQWHVKTLHERDRQYAISLDERLNQFTKTVKEHSKPSKTKNWLIAFVIILLLNTGFWAYALWINWDNIELKPIFEQEETK